MFTKICLLALICVAYSATPTYGSVNIISRSTWGARAPTSPSKAVSVNPVSHVAIHHTTGAGCSTQTACMARLKNIQVDHINNKRWNDIGYNFLVGEDGNVYEGQGWGKKGSHAVKVNAKSIGISIIGTYSNGLPNSAALNAVKELIAYGVANGKIRSDYKLIGHRQVKSTECPGNSLFNEIKNWPHWSSSA